MKKIMTALLVVIGLTFAGCTKQENPAPSVALHAAAAQGNLVAVQQHIKSGSNLNEKEPTIGSTPLITAAFFCHTEIVKALLDKGADKTLRNNAGRSALDTVAAPFENVKSIYDQIGAALEPLGLKLDYERIKTTRPKISEMLR